MPGMFGTKSTGKGSSLARPGRDDDDEGRMHHPMGKGNEVS